MAQLLFRRTVTLIVDGERNAVDGCMSEVAFQVAHALDHATLTHTKLVYSYELLDDVGQPIPLQALQDALAAHAAQKGRE